MLDLIKKAKETHCLSKEEIILLLKDETHTSDLFSAADEVRKEFIGSDVELRALIEFSNYCRNNCCYCGIRRDNRNAQRYRLSSQEIISHARMAFEAGYKTVVLQSGEDVYFTTERLEKIIQAIKETGMAVTLSIGEKTYEEYKAYRDAGADRYLLRIETTDRNLYHRLDPGMSWDNRANCLKIIKELGYELGSGSLVGLPGQSIESIAGDILFFKEIDADMIGIGPFIPHAQTPLANAEGKAFFLSLKMMALTRLLLPDINIPATTAMEVLHPNGRMLALNSGANVVMPNVTQEQYRRLYQLYPGKTEVSAKDCPTDPIVDQILRSGRTISSTKGFRGEYIKGEKT